MVVAAVVMVVVVVAAGSSPGGGGDACDDEGVHSAHPVLKIALITSDIHPYMTTLFMQ